METKGIDLTKCVNCRFRAKVDGNEVEGRIAVEGDYLQFYYRYGRNESCYSMLISFYWEHGKVDYFDDFEIVPRDPETYKDWQVGDIIGFENENGEIDIMPEHLCRVIFRSGELVAIADNCEDADINGVYTCGQIYRECWRLILTDIETKIIEEKERKQKPSEFKKGDPVLVRDYDDNIWKLAAFRLRSGNTSYPYEIRNERGNYYCYRKCIPYDEKTMHLLGTTEDYKEER